LDFESTKLSFELLTCEINQYNLLHNLPSISAFSAALGFLRVANEIILRPIRTLTQGRGFNPKSHILNIFGGAGAQHGCAIAKELGITKIEVNRYCGVLSAFGLGKAEVVEESEFPCNCRVQDGF
jgi:5-oxoprolinase (ATP-hydrolysing)